MLREEKGEQSEKNLHFVTIGQEKEVIFQFVA